MENSNVADRDGLAAMAQSVAKTLLGARYDLNKTSHDAEIPDSSEPERLAQARQATAFVNGEDANPFKDQSRARLASIAHDGSGAFTVNERRAAWLESYAQEQAWKRAAIARMNEEESARGEVSAKTLKSILAHYQSLPPIEQARLPKAYDAQLIAKIQLADSAESGRHQNALRSLLDQLMNPPKLVLPDWQTLPATL